MQPLGPDEIFSASSIRGLYRGSLHLIGDEVEHLLDRRSMTVSFNVRLDRRMRGAVGHVDAG